MYEEKELDFSYERQKYYDEETDVNIVYDKGHKLGPKRLMGIQKFVKSMEESFKQKIHTVNLNPDITNMDRMHNIRITFKRD